MRLDIILTAGKATMLLALLSPPVRGLLAAGACAAVAWAVGLALAAVDWVERNRKGREK